ncbi:MAG: hypothetical protein E6G68_00925 [Actinobacteria bacterium]|nr:MAG: hypothetical protein E6G68_00925 [Actinomycetota bacterium]
MTMGGARRIGMLLLLLAVLAAPLQSVAGTKRSTLRCSWTGTVHAYDDYEGTVMLDLGSGTGYCGFDGTGRYDITALQGHGTTMNFFGNFTFDMRVRYTIVRRSDGGVREFEQRWTDFGAGGFGNFLVMQSASIPVRGLGSADVPFSYSDNPIEPFDAPASFSWTFLKAQQ